MFAKTCIVFNAFITSNVCTIYDIEIQYLVMHTIVYRYMELKMNRHHNNIYG